MKLLIFSVRMAMKLRGTFPLLPDASNASVYII